MSRFLKAYSLISNKNWEAEFTSLAPHFSPNSSLQVLFSKAMPSSRALDLISKFGPIAARPAIKEALERCMLTAYRRYALELEQVQGIYERHKVRGVQLLCIP